MNENLWVYLHDGILTAFEWGAPGEVHITVRVPHLQHMWAEGGHAVHVTLYGCETLRWDSYDTPPQETTTDMEAVEVAAPAILQVQWGEGDDLVLNTECGDLHMQYDFAELKLDTGYTLTIDDLRSKSEAYWNRLK
jgi:hypothetical protein